MTKQADLIAYVFSGQPHPLSSELMQWMEASPRFIAFVDTYRDKIRKKIRVTAEPESALDLRSELEVAYCLLNDRHLSVAYEPYPSTLGRGPDYAVTYRTNQVFNIEVARMRVEESTLGEINLARKEERFLRILLDKLGQMQPAMPNLLVIHTRQDLARSIDLDRWMQALKLRVDGKDPSFYATGRYRGPTAFYKDFLRLNGIQMWTAGGPLWVNKQARAELDEKVLRLLSLLAPT